MRIIFIDTNDESELKVVLDALVKPGANGHAPNVTVIDPAVTEQKLIDIGAPADVIRTRQRVQKNPEDDYAIKMLVQRLEQEWNSDLVAKMWREVLPNARRVLETVSQSEFPILRNEVRRHLNGDSLAGAFTSYSAWYRRHHLSDLFFRNDTEHTYYLPAFVRLWLRVIIASTPQDELRAAETSALA